MQTPVTAEEDTNTKTAQLVKLIAEVGPDIPEISRRLGQFKESVRYRYKAKLLDRGVAVQAGVDHEKLGLKRVICVVDFAKEYRPFAETIMTAMSDVCYVVSFEKIFPSGDYEVQASIPSEFTVDFVRLLEDLGRKGLYFLSAVHVFDRFRILPMMAQIYDFDSGRWDFVWSSPGVADVREASYLPSGKAPFDYTDLLILKERSKDASMSLVEMSKTLGVNYKVLAWHNNRHVAGRGLIKNYFVRWPGTKYDFTADKALHRKHRYFWVGLLVADLTETERMGIMARLGALPFLWEEAVGKDYFAQLALPVDFLTESLQFIEESPSDVRERTELRFFDQTHALSFSFGYRLYNQEKHRWSFDLGGIEKKFDELMPKMKEIGMGS